MNYSSSSLHVRLHRVERWHAARTVPRMHKWRATRSRPASSIQAVSTPHGPAPARLCTCARAPQRQAPGHESHARRPMPHLPNRRTLHRPMACGRSGIASGRFQCFVLAPKRPWRYSWIPRLHPAQAQTRSLTDTGCSFGCCLWLYACATTVLRCRKP